jgi:hypothetical protein
LLASTKLTEKIRQTYSSKFTPQNNMDPGFTLYKSMKEKLQPKIMTVP